VQLARTRSPLALLFARCARRESLQVRRVQRVSARALPVQLARIKTSLVLLFADCVHRVSFQRQVASLPVIRVQLDHSKNSRAVLCVSLVLPGVFRIK
jgi:hypothetical protein